MLTRSRQAVAVLAAAFATGCADSYVTTDPTGSEPVVAPSAAWVSEAEEVARAFALAMADSGVRVAVRDAMRASRVTEHKLVLQEFAATAAGRAIVSAAARASGVTESSLATRIASLPALDFYAPFREHRLTWRAEPTVVIGVAHGEQRILTAYRIDGSSLKLEDNAGVPSDAVLLLRLAERKNRRIDAQADRPGEVIQDPDDGELSGSIRIVKPGGESVVIEMADFMTRGPNGKFSLRVKPGVNPPMYTLAEDCEPETARTECDDVSSGPRPSDTTRIASFKVLYEDGGWNNSHNEPYFKAWYFDTYAVVYFQSILPNVQYDVNADLMYRRMPEGTLDRMKLQLWEEDSWEADDPSTPFYAGPESRQTWLTIFDNEAAPGVVVGYMMLDWTPKPQPAVSRVTLEWNSYPEPARAGCPTFGRADVNAWAANGLQIDLDNKPISLGSLNPDIATLWPESRSSGGRFKIRSNAPGSTTLTATVDGQTGSLAVTVNPWVASVVISPSLIFVAPGEAATLVARAYKNDGQLVTQCMVQEGFPYPMLPTIWRSDNPAVATVDDGGLVRAVSPGTTTIRASIGSFEATATVNIYGSTARVEIVPSSLDLIVGQARVLEAVAYDANGTEIPGKVATWQSSNTAVATVGSTGAVHARAQGSAIISATIDGFRATAIVTVSSSTGGDCRSRTGC
jgi:hypothetical protein